MAGSRNNKDGDAPVDPTQEFTSAFNSASASTSKKRPPPEASAGEHPKKAQRTSRGGIGQGTTHDAANKDDNDNTTDEDVSAGDDDIAGGVPRNLVVSRRSMQKESRNRAPITGLGEVRSEICQRCAGEVARFPSLQCITDPASTAGKCFDCKKKKESCLDVPAGAKGSLAELMAAATAFLNKTGSQEDLDTAQEVFNIGRQRIKHVKKVEDAAATKTPWVPVVAAIEATSADVVSAIDQMGTRIAEALGRVVDVLQEGHNNMLEELRTLSRDIRTANRFLDSSREASPLRAGSPVIPADTDPLREAVKGLVRDALGTFFRMQ